MKLLFFMTTIVLSYALPLSLAAATTQLASKQLITAVQSGSMAKVTRLIGVGANVNSVDNLGRSIAHHAVSRGDLQLLELLLDNGADINVADNYGDTLLHTSIAWEHDTIAEFLLQHGASHTHKNTRDLTPGQYAQELQRSDKLLELLQATEDTQEQQPQQEDQAEADTATQNEQNKKRDRELIGAIVKRIYSKDISSGQLMDFIESGIDLNLPVLNNYRRRTNLINEVVFYITNQHGQNKAIDIIDLMLANGANINLNNHRKSMTALMTAAHYSLNGSRMRIVEFLLKRGADPHLKAKGSLTASDFARLAGCEGSYKMLQNAMARSDMGKEATGLHTAVARGDIQTAAARGDIQTVRDLLAAEDFDKSELKIENKAGQLPFDVAVASKHYGIAALLLRKMIGININKRDPQGWPPLNYALLTKDRELIQEFIRDGAIPTVGRGHYGGQTAFDLVEKMGIEEMLVKILQDEDKLNYTKGKHDAPLIWAVEHNKNKLAKLLLDHGADPYIKNSDGDSALYMAIGHEKIKTMLQEAMQRIDGDTSSSEGSNKKRKDDAPGYNSRAHLSKVV